MGITIPKERLLSTLEAAVSLAESDADLPEEWIGRARRIGECPSRSYIAAFGTALLAKAADDRVDVLTVKASVGPSAYSMRGVVKILAGRASHYGYDLGVPGPEPLNNQPWFQLKRVDRPVSIRADAGPYHRDLVRYLRDLNNLSSDEALEALAAFLRLRLAFRAQQQQAQASLLATGAGALGTLIPLIEHFARENPEGGRRGQALVAALLDLLHPEVALSAVNDPTGLDVKVLRDGTVILGAEVKQKPVEENAALHLADEARTAGVDKALLVAIAKDQRPLDRETIRQAADKEHGVLTIVYESIPELVSHVVAHAPLTASEAAARLPALYLKRMQEHRVSQEGQQYWTDLCASLSE
jgi:hypothetical protein